jgi:carotenoid phi-ring synthase / carotenoid chi-ring synthase
VRGEQRALERAFARPFRGAGDRLATWLSALIGIAPTQVVGELGHGRARLASARDAAVVGGGLAGMSAAIRLAERGYRVRLVERNAYLGGKLGAWPHTLSDGTCVTVEHGFHGFFLQYYNLFALLGEAGVTVADLPLVDDYAIADAEGRRESLRGYPRTPPFNALAMALRSPFMNLREARRMRSFAVMRDAFLRFDVERTPERWDGISFAELTEQMGLAGTGFDAIFKVFGHSFFSESADVSAAEIAKSFHAFFFANPEGLLFRYSRTDFERALWRPLRARLEALGGAVELAREAVAIERDAGSGGFVVRVRSADAPAGDTGAGDTAAGETAPSSRAGAAGAARADAVRADVVVLALDPPGLSALLARSPELRARHPAIDELAARIPPGQPYAVLRLWTDRDCAAHRASFTSLHGRYPLDSITVYHRLEEESAAWAARRGGGVFELHSYTPRADHARAAGALLYDLEHQLADAFSELAGMVVRDRFPQVRWDFPSFPVGRAAARPRTETGVPGLVLAGDWVRLSVPASLMEAAVTSGIAAANALAAADDVAPHPIWSVPTRGVLARFGAP